MRGTARRTRLLAGFAGLLFALLFAWPAAVFGHASPVGTDPADGTVVPVAPGQVTISFNEPVAVSTSGNQLLNALGEPVEAQVSARDRDLIFEPIEPLVDGTYIVAWRVVSADTHPVAGGFSFSIGAPSTETVHVPRGEQQREVELVRIMVEAIRYAGLLAFAGVVWFAAVMGSASGARATSTSRPLRHLGADAATAAVAGQLVLIPISALWESGAPLSDLWSGGTWEAGLRSPVAASAVLVVVGVLIAWLAWGRGWLVAATGAAALALGSVVVVGHTRSVGPSWLVLTADLAHVAAAAVWWGGLLALIVTLRSAPKLRATQRGELIARFSTMAGVAVVALGVGGVVLYWRIAGSVEGLWGTAYGRFVLAKALLLVPVVVIAAWNRTRLVPRLRSRDDRAAAASLSRLMVVETVVIAVVIAVTAVLVTKAPPAPDAPAAVAITEETLSLDLGDEHRAHIAITPARRGINAVRVTVTGPDGQVAAIDGEPSLSITLRASDIGPFDRPLSRTGPGTWEATADLPLEGTWTFALSVPLSRFESPVVTGTVEVP